MRIPRIYQAGQLSLNQLLSLTPEASRHVAQVLRLSVGNALIIFNGQGQVATGSIHHLTKQQTIIKLHTLYEESLESPLTIELAQGICRGDKMDWVIQKGVELGVQHFSPLLTERCGVKMNAQRWDKKMQHWQAIIANACEQSGRNHLPQLNPPQTLHEWLASSTHTLRLLLSPTASQNLSQLAITPPLAISLIIGPEGGLSPAESQAALAAGCQDIRLGPRILRTETAPLAAIAILQAQWGDLN